MNNLNDLIVSGNLKADTLYAQNATIGGALNVNAGIYGHGDIQLETHGEILFGWDNAKIYVRDGRLYFWSKQLGEYSMTPNKEERVKRILNHYDENSNH